MDGYIDKLCKRKSRKGKRTNCMVRNENWRVKSFLGVIVLLGYWIAFGPTPTFIMGLVMIATTMSIDSYRNKHACIYNLTHKVLFFGIFPFWKVYIIIYIYFFFLQIWKVYICTHLYRKVINIYIYIYIYIYIFFFPCMK